MLNKVFTAGLGALAFCGIGAHGATPLYPMRDVGTNATPPQVALAQVESTNQVQVQATTSASVALKPTSIAPSGASGVAEITAHGLLLHVKRLPPGRYDVQIVRKSNSSSEPVAALTIVDPTLGPSRQATDN